MDGTFGGGDLISASLAIMLGGGTDAELHDKEVSLSTSQITGSQTAIFEYNPEDEDPQSTPPGPWDGYSLFTIDLSAVKTDIEGFQQTIDDINQLLEEDDPDYDPTTDDPVQQVNNVIEEKDQKEQEIEECNQCKADVIAKLQEYDPDFDPQTCSDIPPEIDAIAGVDVPTGVDSAPIAFELEADSVASTEIDGKKVTVAFAGRGYRYVEPPNYTPADIDDPIYEYLSGNLYTAFVEQPEQQISPGYGTYMYGITVDGVGTYYGLSISDPHKTTSLAYVSEIAFSNSDLLVKNSNGANMCVFNAAQGKSWSGTSTVKII